MIMENESNQGSDLQTLIEKYVNNTCSKNELKRLADVAKEGSDELFAALNFQWSNGKVNAEISDEYWDKLFGSMMEKAKGVELIEQSLTKEVEPRVNRVGSRRIVLVKIAVAAAVLLSLSTTIFVLFKRGHQEIAQQTPRKSVNNDIAPGGDRAVLTLADGRKIVLDTASNGALVKQGGIKVIKMGGQLSYSHQSNSSQVLYNTITTPRGGQYQVVLPDGSQVWLNAASSLRFPTAFTGKDRRVEIQGEAYFEVSRQKDMPFIVSVYGAEVQVLGTHFNVMAYSDEAAVKTTLLEGSVKLVSGSSSVVLKPQQQSQLTKEGQLKVLNGVDVEDVMAWKNGLFHFENADLAMIMRQLSRWYDVDVSFQNKTDKDLFVMEMPRNSRLSEVLRVLELIGNVRFKIEGKKIIVLP